MRLFIGDESPEADEEITDEQIEALSTRAAQAGDMEMVAICDVALRGEIRPRVAATTEERDLVATRFGTRATARAECARVIAHAAAQEDRS